MAIDCQGGLIFASILNVQFCTAGLHRHLDSQTKSYAYEPPGITAGVPKWALDTPPPAQIMQITGNEAIGITIFQGQ